MSYDEPTTPSFIMSTFNILLNMKSTYLVQPYHVGSKNAKSLALIIPAEVAKGYNITTSTVLALRAERNPGTITLQMIDETIECKRSRMKPVDKSSEASSQQASSIGDQ